MAEVSRKLVLDTPQDNWLITNSTQRCVCVWARVCVSSRVCACVCVGVGVCLCVCLLVLFCIGHLIIRTPNEDKRVQCIYIYIYRYCLAVTNDRFQTLGLATTIIIIVYRGRGQMIILLYNTKWVVSVWQCSVRVSDANIWVILQPYNVCGASPVTTENIETDEMNLEC